MIVPACAFHVFIASLEFDAARGVDTFPEGSFREVVTESTKRGIKRCFKYTPPLKAKASMRNMVCCSKKSSPDDFF